VSARIVALEALHLHVLAMDGDGYLSGHPEWETLVEEAKAIDRAELAVTPEVGGEGGGE
jgi:hypothetical protein